MPVEFLSDDEASAYGCFSSGFARAELERYFFLDDVDRALVEPKRRDHNKLGFAVQLATVRYAGRFLDDPLNGVPVELVDYLAEPLEIADLAAAQPSGNTSRTCPRQSSPTPSATTTSPRPSSPHRQAQPGADTQLAITHRGNR